MTHKALELEELEGNVLPEAITEQVLMQYAEGAGLMVQGCS